MDNLKFKSEEQRFDEVTLARFVFNFYKDKVSSLGYVDWLKEIRELKELYITQGLTVVDEQRLQKDVEHIANLEIQKTKPKNSFADKSKVNYQEKEMCPICGKHLVKQQGCTVCSDPSCIFEKCSI